MLDGKQRLLSLLQFIGEDDESENNKFRLQGLEVLKEFNRKTYDDLRKDPTMATAIDQLNNETIRSVIVRNWPSNAFLHLLFVRLNSESLPLSPQELRQALFPGKFVEYIDLASRESNAIKILLNIDKPDKRMRDVEILVRYLGFALFLPLHEGNLKDFLDLTCDKLNKNWGEKELKIKEHLKNFEQAIDIGVNIFGANNIGRMWSIEGCYSIRLNKAILDVQLFYFSDNRIAQASIEKKVEVEQAFKNLCLESEEFRNSIESTTKSIKATHTRLHLWGKALNDVLKMDFNIPTLESNRIKFTNFWK